ncbi:MAG: bifunctional folylpolyglutamate synthase/dihydrofolate synthase [Clostridia bacterium]|nr:bifunctional folylpolyglutamate synthase/dihydrofolate synthase [Clostridia bacterium]
MNRFVTAKQAETWINGERWKGEKRGLENTRALLEILGHPETRMGRILHVAGTNGKGSTCAYLSGALTACGYKTGLFTSPYLRRFNERISLNGQPIPDEALADVASRVADAAEEAARSGIFATTFELLTVCACEYYAREHTDFAVMEVGMGGRLDSTNVLPSSVSLIAAIGFDHMARLGNTLPEIAAEKAGIFKSGVPAVVMQNPDSVMRVFAESAQNAGAELYIADKPRLLEYTKDGSTFECTLPVSGRILQSIRVRGAHQADNACLALSALDLLGIDMEAARRGVARAYWPGRLDLIGNILIDCAHNPQGAYTLKEYVDTFFSAHRKVLLTGMMQDKQIDKCAEIFASFADETVTTAVSWPRAISACELAKFYPDAHAVENEEAALAAAVKRAGSDGLVICAGSVYLAGDVLNILSSAR